MSWGLKKQWYIKKRSLLWFGHVEPMPSVGWREEDYQSQLYKFTCTRGWKEKQRETEEDLDGQCQGRPEEKTLT